VLGRGRLVTRVWVVTLVLCGFAFANTHSARGATLCVQPTPLQAQQCTPDKTFTGVQAALDAAKPASPGGAGADRIIVGDGDFTGPFCYLADESLEIMGDGSSNTHLIGPAGACHPVLPAAVLTLHNLHDRVARTQLTDLEVRIPNGNNAIGVYVAGGSMRDVKVTADAGAVNPTGVVMAGLDGSMTSSAVELPVAASVGVQLDAFAAHIARSRITAVTGVRSNGQGLGSVASTAFFLSSIVRIADAPSTPDVPPVGLRVFGAPGASGCEFDEDANRFTGFGSVLMLARNLTVYGNGREDETGIELQTGAATSTTPSTGGTLTLASSVVDNVGAALRRQADGGAGCIALFFDSYSGGFTNTGPGVICCGNIEGPRNFVDPAHGDFGLRPGSALIDAGDTLGHQFGDSLKDVEGKARILDASITPGDNGCKAVRDIGAFEYDPRTLLARASVIRAGPAGQVTELDASASCDPNPDATLSYSWSFDDGGTAGGAQVMHTFSTPGDHSATLTVTSSDGRAASDTVTVAVPPAAAEGAATVPAQGKPKAASDRKRPRARRLDLRPRKFRAAGAGASIARSVGAVVRYRLSEPASMRFTVQRLVRNGHKRLVGVRGSFTHRGRADANKFRFTGRIGGHRLRPGKYRLVGVPKDGAGNRGKAVRTGFRVVRR
jgi:PKD domain-containing protein